MDSKNSPDIETQHAASQGTQHAVSLLAAHLAKPYLLPRQSGQPLSLRKLEDGGMVVIAADGRKMWFTALEVSRARRELNQPQEQRPRQKDGAKVTILHDPDPRRPVITSQPPSHSRDGMSEMIVLPKELKHVEDLVHANARKYQRTRPADSG